MFGPDQTVGYVRTVVTCPREGTSNDREYFAESVTTFPNRAKLSFSLGGKITPTFEPIDLTLVHSLYKPESGEQLTTIRCTVGSEKVKMTGKSGDKENVAEVPRPKEPFFMGIESLVARLDHFKFDRFAAREFDLKAGSAGYLTFSTEQWNDGTPTIVTRRLDGSGSYQFWFDQNGALIRWGEPSLPVVFVRTACGDLKEYRQQFGVAPVLPTAQNVEKETKEK